MAEKQWQIDKLQLHWSVVWSLALSSLRVRLARAFITGLTITTATAFMMFLLSMPFENASDPTAPGIAGLMGLRIPVGQDAAEAAIEIEGFMLMLVLSLIVAASGVLNTMLMSVAQRYREIGTIKCLGGLDMLVLFSVLFEAAMLGLIGAVIGVVVGLAISMALSLADYGGEFLAHVNWTGLPLKVLFVFVVGMLLTTFGAAVPAYIASRMPPIEAMRGEK